MRILVQADAFDLGAEVAALHAANPKVGAVAAFLGLVRDHSPHPNPDETPTLRYPPLAGEGEGGGATGIISTLTLEHYPGMTERALEKIARAAAERWQLLDVTVIHRVGELHPTEPIVMVAVASAHRGDAFAACEFIMDYLKTEAPFWKKEQTPEGPRWVEARESDDAAAARWKA